MIIFLSFLFCFLMVITFTAATARITRLNKFNALFAMYMVGMVLGVVSGRRLGAILLNRAITVAPSGVNILAIAIMMDIFASLGVLATPFLFLTSQERKRYAGSSGFKPEPLAWISIASGVTGIVLLYKGVFLG